ncbi:MAG: helix-turn-helix transcriptional regulator [Syntrophomonas sp.]
MFGDILAELRKNKGLSQYELSEQLGLSRGQISNYELGTRQPDYDTLLRIAEYFNVTTDYLLGRTNNKIPSKANTFLQNFFKLMKDERGMISPEGIVLGMLETLKLYAAMNGVPLTALPNIEITSDQKEALTKELAQALDVDPARDMAEQIKELSPEGQNAIRSMLDALKIKDEKTATKDDCNRNEMIAAHRDDDLMHDLPEDSVKQIEKLQRDRLKKYGKI